MEIVDEHTHRVLMYVDALNRHGVRPGRDAVDDFAANPEPLRRQEPSAHGALRSMLLVQRTINERYGTKSVQTETFSTYLERLGWLEEDDAGGASLTALSRALLKSLNAPALDDATADLFEVVLNPENPFAYAQALGGLGSVEDALLVEPYFRLQQLIDIADLGNVRRVLVGHRLSVTDYKQLAAGLGALGADAPEIRKAEVLHDRYLIPAETGHVLMLGASIGGLGRKVSTMTTLGPVASDALRQAHEEIWDSAEVLEPTTAQQSPTVD